MSKILVALLSHSIIFILQAQAFHDDIGNLAKLRQTFDKNAETISTMTKKLQSDSKDKVVILGSTGSGKDTFINYLAKKQLIANELHYLDVEDPLEGTKIGHANSTTRTPGPWVSPDNTVFWNCPGFGDTAGVEHDILNMCMIRQIVNGNTKLLLLYPGAEIEANRSSLMRMIGNILTMYSLDNLNGRFGLVITKKFAHEDASLFLKQYVERMRQGECSDDNALAEIDYISTNNLVMRFPEPTEVGLYPTNYLQPIMDTINRLQYMSAGYLKYYPSIPKRERNIVRDFPYSQVQIRYLQEKFGYLHELGIDNRIKAAIERAYYKEKQIFFEKLPNIIMALNEHCNAIAKEHKEVMALRITSTYIVSDYGTFKEPSKEYKVCVSKTAIEATENHWRRIKEKHEMISTTRALNKYQPSGLVTYFTLMQGFVKKPLLMIENLRNMIFLSSLLGKLFKDSQSICTARPIDNIRNFFKKLTTNLEKDEQIKKLVQNDINALYNITEAGKIAADEAVRPIRMAAMNFRVHIDPVMRMLFGIQSEDFYNELSFQIAVSLLTLVYLAPSLYHTDFVFPNTIRDYDEAYAKICCTPSNSGAFSSLPQNNDWLSQQNNILHVAKKLFFSEGGKNIGSRLSLDAIIGFIFSTTLPLILCTSKMICVLNNFNIAHLSFGQYRERFNDFFKVTSILVNPSVLDSDHFNSQLKILSYAVSAFTSS